MSDPVAEQLALWPAQRAQREAIGDRLDEPRELDHVAYFRSKSSAATAAGLLTAAGFRVAVSRGLFRTTLQASRDDALDDDSVARVLGEVVPIVVAYGGMYDGFGGMTVD